MELTDGTLRATSLLNLDHDVPAGKDYSRLWHLGCLAPDTLPAGSEA